MPSFKLAVLCFVVLLSASLPVIGHAQSSPSFSGKKKTVASKTSPSQPATTAKAAPRYREIYWITNETATGSRLPVVYRIFQRDGQTLSITAMNTMTPNRVLRNVFGASDVSSILRQEPAFH